MATEKHRKTHPLADFPDRYLNRELSWLSFNARVLEESANPANPVLERLHFLSISAANLDEFYMVRVAGLKDYVHHHVSTLSIDGLTPMEELKRIHREAGKLVQRQQQCWLKLKRELQEKDVHVIGAADLSKKEKQWLAEHFINDIFPALTPIAVDPAHPFPFLPNLGMALVLQLAHEKNGNEQIALVPLPSNLNRFVRLPGRKKLRLLLLEDVLEAHLETLFPGFRKLAGGMFRVIRDSELDLEEEGDDFVRNFERAVKQRRRGKVIRLKFIGGTPKPLVQFVSEQVHADAEDVLDVEGMLGLSSLREIYALADSLDDPSLKYPPYTVRFPERINDFGGDCFAAIAAKDLVVHHPFESFDVVVQFLKQAAKDPDVIAIKQTLYRTSQDSPIARALIEAAEAGKSVTALVELKARFDEEANIRWARDLERAGAHVVYGFVKLKTHAKVSLVTRRAEGKLVSYVHFGTGNYHPNTARIYTDLSFFTCDQALCRDAAYFFNFVTGYAVPKSFKKLIVAPLHMRKQLLELIADEIAHAKAGRPAAIWAKMNALVDREIIDALYRASQAGVQVDLVVRSICCLKPGVPGLSDHIRVKSIIGRFLEHSRIFCFGNGQKMPSPGAKVFLSSADWMPRNLDWRVEVMVPVENPTVHAQILDKIMVANLKDDKQSWMLKADGAYERRHAASSLLSAHEYFIANPSLSGRGKALKHPKGENKAKNRFEPMRKAT